MVWLGRVVAVDRQVDVMEAQLQVPLPLDAGGRLGERVVARSETMCPGSSRAAC